MKELKKNVLDYLSVLEGYHCTLKTLHWSASNHSLHVLTDDIDGSVLETLDKIAECVMGLLNTKFGNGDLKCMLPESTTLDALLKEMKNDLIDFKKQVGDTDELCGLQNILDDYMSNINKWNYLKTLL